jgi:lysophospholipase L1-like esterase
VLKPGDFVLFQGDSITHAFRKPEEVGTSYRMGAGWAMMVSAQLQAQRPDWKLRFDNRGECGHGVDDLLTRWQQDCLDLRPDVVSLLVGVNDTNNRMKYGRGNDAAQFRERYARLLAMTRQELPEVRLILCEPFLLPTGRVTGAWLDDLAPRRQAVRELAAEFQAVFVPLQQALLDAAAATGEAYWLFDGIHPNAAGQWLIMQAWLAAVCPDSLRAGASQP